MNHWIRRKLCQWFGHQPSRNGGLWWTDNWDTVYCFCRRCHETITYTRPPW